MPCQKCGECCKTLYWSDRIKISLKTRTLMLSKVCKFLDKNNLCKMYSNRPNVCKNWRCSASKDTSISQHTHTGVYSLSIKDNKILLIKKTRGPYTGQWDLPGGRLEFGEKPLDGLVREVMEETGLAIEKSELLDVLSHTVFYETETGEKREMHHIGIIYKTILDFTKNLKTNPDGHDSAGACWLELSELNESEVSPFVNQSLKLNLK